MSLVQGFKPVVAMFVGLACSAAWATDERAKSKIEEAQAEEIRQESVVTGAGTLTRTSTGVLTLSGPAVYSSGTVIVSGQATAVAAQAGGGMGMAVDAAGAREVVREQYGKKITITEDPQYGIKIERVTKKGGTDVTERYEAKNVAELKKKYPEGFKVFDECLPTQAQGGTLTLGVVQGQGQFQLQQAQGPILLPGGGAIPPAGIVPPGGTLVLPPAGFQMIPGQGQVVVTASAVLAQPQLEELNAMMQGLSEGLKSYGKADKSKETLQTAKDHAKKQIGELKKQLADLEKQLDAK